MKSEWNEKMNNIGVLTAMQFYEVCPCDTGTLEGRGVKATAIWPYIINELNIPITVQYPTYIAEEDLWALYRIEAVTLANSRQSTRPLDCESLTYESVDAKRSCMYMKA